MLIFIFCLVTYSTYSSLSIRLHQRKFGSDQQIRYNKYFVDITGGNIGSKFKLNSVTGLLSASSLDREVVPKYVLTITAKDNGQPSLETRCNLTVVVVDVNDNSPIFLHNEYSVPRLKGVFSDGNHVNHSANSFIQGKYSATISEDVVAESSIMQVRATDADQGVNGKITYFIDEENTWLFRIDNLTGIITTTG